MVFTISCTILQGPVSNDEDTSSKALVKIDGELLYLTQDAGYTRRRADGGLECMITGRIHGDAGGYVKVQFVCFIIARICTYIFIDLAFVDCGLHFLRSKSPRSWWSGLVKCPNTRFGPQDSSVSSRFPPSSSSVILRYSRPTFVRNTKRDRRLQSN